MKKVYLFLIVLFVVASFGSCTENERARSFGGNQTVYLAPGVKLVNATWKEADLWYLTEPMDSAYIPKTFIFIESSAYGLMEGKVTFIEQSYNSQR